MRMTGYIKLHRSLLDHPVFSKKEPVCEEWAFSRLMLQAKYRPTKVRAGASMVEIGRGQVATSYRNLSEEWRWGKGRIERYLKLLQSEGMIEVKSGRELTIITICNYEYWQGREEDDGTPIDTQTGCEQTHERDANGTQTGRKRDANGTQTGRYKEYKEGKERKEGGDAQARETPPPPRKNYFSKKISDAEWIGLDRRRNSGQELSEIEMAQWAIGRQQRDEDAAKDPAVQAKVEELRKAKAQEKPKESADEDNPEPVWKAVKDELRQKEGEDTYKSWLQQLRLAEMNDDSIIITAPTAFAVTWIEGKFLQKIEKSFALVTERKRPVSVMLRQVAV